MDTDAVVSYRNDILLLADPNVELFYNPWDNSIMVDKDFWDHPIFIELQPNDS